MSQHVELPAWECADLLRSRTVGRICVIDLGCPIAIPVNYEVMGNVDNLRIVVRTAPETILGRYEGLASIEVDEIELNGSADGERSAWSVIGRGTLHRVSGPHELPDPRPIIDGGRELWLTLQVSAASGRRFTIRRDETTGAVDWKPRT